jgi:hypothetical protein
LSNKPGVGALEFIDPARRLGAVVVAERLLDFMPLAIPATAVTVTAIMPPRMPLRVVHGRGGSAALPKDCQH